MSISPRGVAVVIPPWNFPLAIPCGMAVAALVAGNTVDPQAGRAIARHRLAPRPDPPEAGLPPGVPSYLPGVAKRSARPWSNIRMWIDRLHGLAHVGLLDQSSGGRDPPGQDHVKRVIAEMGGKNAIIVDDDADLDEAVVGVLEAPLATPVRNARHARGRSFWKEFTMSSSPDWPRLPAPSRSARPTIPDTLVGPVIDAEARKRIEEYRQIAVQEGRVVRIRMWASWPTRHLRRPPRSSPT